MAIYRVTIQGTLFELGVQCQNVLHIENPEGTFSPEQIATDFQTNWIAAIRSLQAGVFRYDTITVRNFSTGNPQQFIHTVSPPIVGASGNNIMHPCVCYVIRLKTAGIGRRFRGRFYLAGVHTGNMARTRPSTAGLTAWNTVRGALLRYTVDGPNNPGFHLVVQHKDDLNSGAAVTDLQLAPIMGIQRRRNELVGV